MENLLTEFIESRTSSNPLRPEVPQDILSKQFGEFLKKKFTDEKFMAKQIMAFMKNYHPHCKLIADTELVEIVEGLKCFNKNEPQTESNIHSDKDCVFMYCPTPDLCKEKGCQCNKTSKALMNTEEITFKHTVCERGYPHKSNLCEDCLRILSCNI